MNTTISPWCKGLALTFFASFTINASWENSMMRNFSFVNTTTVDDTYDFGDGTSPSWAVLQTFEFDTSDTDSGFVSLAAGITYNSVTEVEGVFALRLDNTIIGIATSSTDGWGIVKWRIHGTQMSQQVSEWSQGIRIFWPIPTSLLSSGTHTLELLGGWTYSDQGTGWSIINGANMTFIGFPNSTITT